MPAAALEAWLVLKPVPKDLAQALTGSLVETKNTSEVAADSEDDPEGSPVNPREFD